MSVKREWLRAYKNRVAMSNQKAEEEKLLEEFEEMLNKTFIPKEKDELKQAMDAGKARGIDFYGEFYGMPPVTENAKKDKKLCDCGAHKVYGLECSIRFHSDWCNLIENNC